MRFDVLQHRWRIGSQVGRTLYIDPGQKYPGNLFGMVDDQEVAQHIVDLHNAWLDAQSDGPISPNEGGGSVEA